MTWGSAMECPVDFAVLKLAVKLKFLCVVQLQ